MSFFGTLWAVTGIMGLQGWGHPYVSFAVVLAGIVLIAGGFSILFKARKLPEQSSAEETGRGKRMGFWFNIVFIIQGVAIGITIAVCNAVNQTELIPFIIAIIVGLHFIPLAALFQIRLYYVVGGLLCLISLIALLMGSVQVQLGEHAITVPLSLLGFGSAILLWATALYFWLSVRNI